MIYPITLYGSSVLKKEAMEITEETNVSKLVTDMFLTMKQAQGVGLAAPQIDQSLSLFVIDMELDGERFKKVFINPIILEESGPEWFFEEGCLSLPGLRGPVSRKTKILIEYFNENWELIEEEYEGMKARVIQHEYEHLLGKLWIDRISPITKKLFQAKLAQIRKSNVKVNYKINI
jgi:peptide deformylase